jgi:hypothetical protein
MNRTWMCARACAAACAVVFLSVGAGCGSESEPGGDVGAAEQGVQASWALDPRFGMVPGALRTGEIKVCVEWRDVTAPSSETRQSQAQAYAQRSMTGLLDWFSRDPRTAGVRVSGSVALLHGGCPAPNLEAGLVSVFLYASERLMFKAAFGDVAPSPTLGVYHPGRATLYLNVEGLTNPAREDTGGDIVVRHEWGHALGLDHDSSKSSIMQPFFPQMARGITAGDIADYREIINQVQRQ